MQKILLTFSEFYYVLKEITITKVKLSEVFNLPESFIHIIWKKILHYGKRMSRKLFSDWNSACRLDQNLINIFSDFH